MGYTIKVYIPVECEDPEVYDTKEEAKKDIESLKLMQPENIYIVEDEDTFEKFINEQLEAERKR